MKRITFAFIVALLFTLVSICPSPLSRKVEAQGQVAFGATRFPVIEVDNNDNIFLAMSVATAPAAERRPHSQIFFTKSNDYGETWDNLPLTRNLTNSPGEAFGPSVAITKQGTKRIYITYHDNSTGTTQAYLIRSKKKTKFRKPANITPHEGGAFSPRLAVDSNENIFVTWTDGEVGSRVAFVRSTDQGVTFTEPLYISGSSLQAFDPAIVVDPGDGINLVWEDFISGTGTILFARSTDGGATFSEPSQVSEGANRASEARIATDSAGRLSVAWVQSVGDTTQAFYSRSTDDGATFSEPVNVSNFPGGDIHKPVIATFEDSRVYIAFQNGDLFGENAIPDRQVYLVKSNNAGESFSDAVQISNANNNQGRAHSLWIAFDSRGVLHMVWIDASIIGKNLDEGLVVYANTPNGQRLDSKKVILAVMIN